MKNNDIAKQIVDRMIDAINQGGSLPWVKPWRGEHLVKVINGFTEITITPQYWNRRGTPYNGINTLILGLSGKTGEMITFKQCQSEGGRVKKGAKGATIVYWNQYRKETEDVDPKTGKKIVVTIPLLKTYTVFSVETDCEGLKPKHKPAPITVQIPLEHWETTSGVKDNGLGLIPEAEAVIADYLRRASTLTLHRDAPSDRAYYSPAIDSVTVPHLPQFEDVSEYYSTLFHELGHSTGHSSRLNRFAGKAGSASFGSEEYSREELVAEITSATILSILGLESGNSFRNSTAYVAGWSKKLQADPMTFITASSRADKAIDLILNLNTEATKEEDVA